MLRYEQVCMRFADGSVSSWVPVRKCTTVVREGLGQVWMGPAARESKVLLEDGSLMTVDAQVYILTYVC
jgi:hypothetical protein